MFVDVCKPDSESQHIHDTVSNKSGLRSAAIHDRHDHTAQGGDPYDLPLPAGCISRNPPYPGAGIGQWADKELGSGALGTLTGYIRHGGDLFGLTCLHVVRHGKGSFAESPDPILRRSLLQRIVEKFPGILPSNRFHRLRIYLASVISSETSDLDFWRQFLAQFENWNFRLGLVASTSITPDINDFDWALVQLTPGQHQRIPHLNCVSLLLLYISKISLITQHPPFNRHDASSGFQLRPDFVSEKFTNTDLTNAKMHFHKGPSFKPIRLDAPQKLEICLKPPSRRTPEWRVGEISAIPTAVGSRQPGATGSVTRYPAIIASHGSAVFSKMGDSGSVVLDKDYRPFGMIQAGIVGIGRSDITHIISLADVERNIEIVNNWELNSVEFCH